MDINYSVWAAIALMHFVAVVSPGPDFAVVLKQGLQKGLKPALWTSFGISMGILLHVTYSVLGISLLIKTTPWLFSTLLYIAAAYFIYIGFSALKSKAPTNDDTKNDESEAVLTSSKWYKSFMLGFLTNGLNPKATLFFLALFTVAIPASSSLHAKIFYGLYLALATLVWFCFVSYVSNIKKIRKAYQTHGYWFDRFMGLVLITMAILLLFT
ncbi:LysE family translocator [Glaciecola sp. 2405UD65-10]|uniref:LysE family translocator n=1 Tax=Glaciecola sp. 2405UD65-10 TaxID=3397244 RepID=UPI003B5A703A